MFTGIATNVCVESTLRDGFHWSTSVWYWPMPREAGPEFAQQAALYNIETFFGWVSSVDAFCRSFATAPEGGGRQLITPECPTAAPAEASAGFA